MIVGWFLGVKAILPLSLMPKGHSWANWRGLKGDVTLIW